MAFFSDKLANLLASGERITLKDLVDKFSEKSFAILFLLLMATPALPLPTGGITHLFEIIVAVLAAELILGRKTVWLPKKWIDLTLPRGLQGASLTRLIKLLRWFEKYSKYRSTALMNNSLTTRAIGIVVLLFTLFAFLAPPFSGLDTLPALGVVILSLALILEDVGVMIIGLLVGSAGIFIILFLGRAIFKLF